MEKEDLIIPLAETEKILLKTKEKWNYDRHDYWYPERPKGHLIMHHGKWVVADNNESKPDFDWFFIMEQFIGEQYHRILNLLFKTTERIYYVPLFCIEENMYHMDRFQFEKYKDDCAEYTCFPEDLSWIYYRGHEGTVSFAGTILNEAKRILASEKKRWNEFSY